MAKTVLVLGSGPIRIGQGIEFDYSCVHCVWALREAGHRALIINNNPETVSTDFDTGDGLYFEPVVASDEQIQTLLSTWPNAWKPRASRSTAPAPRPLPWPKTVTSLSAFSLSSICPNRRAGRCAHSPKPAKS